MNNFLLTRLRARYTLVAFSLWLVAPTDTLAQTPNANNQFQGRVTVYSPVKQDSASQATDTDDKGPIENSIDYLQKPIAAPTSSLEGGFGLFKDSASKQKAVQTGATLVLVLSVFLTLVMFWKMRPGAAKDGAKRRTRRRRSGNQTIPGSIVTVLGQLPFVQNQQLQLLRLGSRLLLVSVSSNGTQTLGEINDPNEVLEIERAFETGQFEHLAGYFKDMSRINAAASQNRDSGSRRRPQLSLGSQHSSTQYADHGRTLLEA